MERDMNFNKDILIILLCTIGCVVGFGMGAFFIFYEPKPKEDDHLHECMQEVKKVSAQLEETKDKLTLCQKHIKLMSEMRVKVIRENHTLKSDFEAVKALLIDCENLWKECKDNK